MKPRIFEIKSEGGIASHLYYCFIHWLEMDVYDRKKCYSNEANPLVITPKEIELLKNFFDKSIIPYISINGEISEDEIAKTKKILEKVLREYFGSIDEEIGEIDLIETKDPGNDEEFQNFLIYRLIEVGGNRYYCSKEQREKLPEYVSLFCVSPKFVKILSEKIVRYTYKIAELEDAMGPGD